MGRYWQVDVECPCGCGAVRKADVVGQDLVVKACKTMKKRGLTSLRGPRAGLVEIPPPARAWKEATV